ncbi:MAG: hypothetical protein HZB33_04390 [Nitrospirae bacterium]|nr:hypothetical protein [Nitrospirota bacterium]
MSTGDDTDGDDEEQSKESEDYWSFLQEYNVRDQPYRLLLWEYGDKDGAFQCTKNPTFGYWDDYYSDLEASFIASCLIYEVRILGERISFQEIQEAERENIDMIECNRAEKAQHDMKAHYNSTIRPMITMEFLDYEI